MTVDVKLDGLLDEAAALQPRTVALRRSLHRHPEIGLQLPRTQQATLDAIGDLGLRVHTGRSVTSVVAVLDGAAPGPTVLLRGDMDALPLREDTGLEFASQVDGAMHACGHDTHVAMLAGAARILAARRQDLTGRVVFMFQPGEEGLHGARYMLEEGLLEVAGDGAAPVGAAFALHISTQYESGTLNLRPGPTMASGDRIEIVVNGRSGHASAPYRSLDPVPIACEIVQALQAVVTRTVDVFDPAVITIARIAAGTTHNIIPERAEMLGTMRTLSEANREALRARVIQVAEGIAAAHGTTASVDVEAGYPVTVNDPAAAELLGGVTADLVGADRVRTLPDPVMGSEDFSYVLQRVPGAMAFLGGCPPGTQPEQSPPNHSRQVVFDEDALTVGVATYAGVALRRLAAGG
ncbi:MAG TPA: M20 family metallopeptidase [Actinomycetes bacterium]|jgi:hippurate hydrolase|nr:M20 family metallopeptidase [Actinomycetes bacterium]